VRGRLATVGVYGFSAESFLDAVRAAGVGRVIDVRQRRGVRGAEYAWANSKRLQAALAEAKVEYEHRPELAPTTELRRLQYAEDARRGEGKRSRSELAPEYVCRYTEEILEPVGVEDLARSLQAGPLAALLCVERDPEACHRSLIAARLAEEHGFEVEDLRP
jgi:uncharacterized protein (DUF488 family)